MDDLLAYMEDGPVPSSTNSQREKAKAPATNEMDDLIALMEDDEDDGEAETHRDESFQNTASNRGSVHEDEYALFPGGGGAVSPSRNLPIPRNAPRVTPPSNKAGKSRNSQEKRQRTEKKSSAERRFTSVKPVTVGIDDRLGIRMINPHISSVDLLDLLSSGAYFSPASLSAMSLQRWNTLLVDPAAIVDRATVSGKTNAITAGIVFSNSGTRVSAKGSAFCILTIGSFVSGPCVTVFLFGDCYSKYNKACVPGKVIALNCPKLLPPRNADGGKMGDSGDTSISFSVTALRQVMPVATARDFGLCKAAVRAKQADGRWTQTGSCKNYVDKRRCEYCDKHKKQMLKQTGADGMSAGGKNNLSKMDQLRSDMLGHQRNASSAAQRQIQGQGNNFQQQSAVKPSVVNVLSNKFLDNSAGNNRLLNPTTSVSATRDSIQNGLASRVPMHMKRNVAAPKPPMRGQMHARQAQTSQNPFFRRKLNTQQQHTAVEAPPKVKRAVGIIGGKSSVGGKTDWLNGSTQRKRADTSGKNDAGVKKPRRRLANAVGAGFDGSVVVPKPNKVLFNRAPAPLARTNPADAVQSRGEDARTRQAILDKQCHVAAVRKGQPLPKEVTKNRLGGMPGQRRQSSNKPSNASGKQDTFSALFGDVSDNVKEKILSAKSKFAHEADAEDFACNRGKLVELEKLEATQLAKEKKKEVKTGMLKEWVCRTCAGRRFESRPVSCFKSGHNVRLVRDVSSKSTKEDERTKLNDKSATEGGLNLGSGLEWSNLSYKRFS